MSASGTIVTYREFWHFYLTQHAKPATRAVHIAATTLGAILLIAALVMADARLVACAMVVGYGPAWLAHAIIEKNRPVTFRYPLWSLFSDLRMVVAWLSGNLEHELEKAGIS